MDPYGHIRPPSGLVIDADVLRRVIYRILLSYTATPDELVPHLHGHLVFLHIPDSPDEIMLHTPNYDGKKLVFPYYCMVPREAKDPIRELATRAGHCSVPLAELTHLTVGIPLSKPLVGVYSIIQTVSIVSVPLCKAHPLRLNPVLYDFGNMLRWFDTTDEHQALMVSAMLEACSIHLTKRLVLRLIAGKETPGIEIYVDPALPAPGPVQNPMVLDVDNGRLIQFDPVPTAVPMAAPAVVDHTVAPMAVADPVATVVQMTVASVVDDTVAMAAPVAAVVAVAAHVDDNPLPEQILEEEYDEYDMERLVPMAPIAPTERMVPTSSSMGVAEDHCDWEQDWVAVENRGMLLEEEEEEQFNEDSEESPVEDLYSYNFY